MTTNAVENAQFAKRMRASSDARALLSVGAGVVAARDLDELGRAVRAHLSAIGIPRCFVLRLSGSDPGAPGAPGAAAAQAQAQAQVVLAHEPDERKADSMLGATYPASDVLRRSVLPDTGGDAFAVSPVRFASQAVGLLAFELAGAVEGYGYEMLWQVFAAVLDRMAPDGG